MIDFSKISAPIRIDTNFILSKVDEVQIFYYYFGHFELGKCYPSKFRKDRNPSTGFYLSKNGALIYNDLKTGEKYNCFTFVAKLHNLTFKEAINRIASDFGLINGETTEYAKKILSQSIDFDRDYKKQTLIQFIPGKWTLTRLKYWMQYELTKDELRREEVYPVDKLFINKAEIKVDELCFAYIVRERIKGKEDVIYIKIYSPYSQRMKWLSNVPLTIPFGLSDLNYNSNHIVVTKAKKDMMVLRKLFLSVIGTQNESESALSDNLVRHLTFNFPQRTIIWDADETGVENCKKFNSKGFGYFNTPRELLEQDIKDVSDYVKAFGLEALEQLFKTKRFL